MIDNSKEKPHSCKNNLLIKDYNLAMLDSIKSSVPESSKLQSDSSGSLNDPLSQGSGEESNSVKKDF